MGVYIKKVQMSKIEPFFKMLGLSAEDGDLIEVKEPHGRLIDANELVKHCREEDEMFGDWVVDVRRIHNAPTVIEAEDR